MQVTKRVAIATQSWEVNILISLWSSSTIPLNCISKGLNRGWRKIEHIINPFSTKDIHLCELEFTLSMLLIVVITQCSTWEHHSVMLNIYVL